MKTFFLSLFTIIIFSSCNKNNEIVFLPEITFGEFSFRGADADDSRILISGSSGKVFVFQNETWKNISSNLPSHLDFRDCQILNDSTYVVMSSGSDTLSNIYITKNHGENWTNTYQNKYPTAFFNGIDFIDEHVGVLISDPIDNKIYVLRTTDGGYTWSRTEKCICPELKKGEYGFAASGSGIKMISRTNYALITGGEHSRFMQTSNNGNHWNIIDLEIQKGINSKGAYSFDMNQEKGLIIGGGDWQDDQIKGKNFLYYNSDFKRKNLKNEENLKFLSCVKFIESDYIIATGTAGTAIYCSSGKTWNYQSNITGFHTIAYSMNLKMGVLAGGKGKVQLFTIK